MLTDYTDCVIIHIEITRYVQIHRGGVTVNRKSMSKKLRELRGDRTIDEVAAGAGVGRSAMNNYELGIRTPRDEIKVRIAEYYNVSVQWLFYEGDNTKREVS